MSNLVAIEGMTFNTQLEQLLDLLERLNALHEQEVAEARRETADLHSQLSAFDAGHEPEEEGDALIMSEANSEVPDELQPRGADHVRFSRQSSESSSQSSVYAGETGQIRDTGIVDEAMVTLEGFGESPAVARWARLIHKMHVDWSSIARLVRPKSRFEAMKSAGFVSLPVWFIANRVRLMRENSLEENDRWVKLKSSVVVRTNSLSSWISAPSATQPRKCPVMHPNSKARTVWVALCLVLIMYDVVVVPIDTFFGLEDDTSINGDVLQVTSIVCCIFWTLDMVTNFATGTYIAGVLVMEPGAIALAYAKTWLFFDISMIIADWLSTLLRGAGTPAQVQYLRGLRFLRLLRVLRLGRLQLALEQLLNVPHEGVIVGGAMIKIVFGLTLIVHVFGCVWYGVGRISDDGWAHDPVVVSNSIAHNYLLSVHWFASQVHGSSRPMAVTTLEHSFADISLIVGFCLFVFVVANGTLTAMHFSKVDRWKMQAACARFSDSHRISQTLSARMQHYLVLGHRRGGISEKVKEDAELLLALPPSVRADAIDEARWPLLKRLQVFALLQNLNARTVRTLCQDAISVSVVLEQGLVFENGDPGKSVFLIQFGEFLYEFKGGARKSGDRDASRMTRILASTNNLLSPALAWGKYVSEAVLWTKWEHVGDLVAFRDSTTLVLSPESFTNTVRERQDLLDVVASYASTYVQKLNHAELATDLFEFKLNVQTLDETDDLVTNRHHVFLSHYKAEAGTEATLMKESLTKMIFDDGNHPAIYFHTPVFLDSANLQDLSLLRKSVSNSDNLVLLLTPGVLTRPWCLVEIVTAFNEFVRIVPVEVQRPGLSFKYPDEHFFHQLATGKLLSKDGEQVLRSEGVDLGEVERSLRQVFQQIAMPFSPHKSTQIRQAELADILHRCSGGTHFRRSSGQTACSGVPSLL